MANVFDAADFFISLANRSEEDFMTNLKLNKLLYFAQGYHFVKTGRKLFENDIEAWQYGPVVSEVYHRYKVCGRNPITGVDDNYSQEKFDDAEFETLLDVAREYGKYSASYLVELTHKKGGVWDRFYNEGCNNVIPVEDIGEYFRNSYDVKAHTFSELIKLTNIQTIGYHNSAGVLVLPKDEDEEDDDEWDEYE